MKIKLGFLTGCRSEYGIAKSFLRVMANDPDIELSIYSNGVHLLRTFGNTIDEIISDGFKINRVIKTHKENEGEKAVEFIRSVEKIYKTLKGEKLDCIFIIGDRLEAYAGALAAHFMKLPILHSGGGCLTKGAIDNIYRYNITNLAKIHITTSKTAYQRILALPLIEKKNVYFTGSPAIDGILEFKQNPKTISDMNYNLKRKKFVLMNFHPVTNADEPIPEIMDAAIEFLLRHDYGILITYPNNDSGFKDIINTINKWSNNRNVFVQKHLGTEYFYAAINDCDFLIGNSSSGIIEAPYFNKVVINVGRRQDGRDKDKGITDVEANRIAVCKKIKSILSMKRRKICGNNLYGRGNTSAKLKSIIKKNFGQNNHRT